MFLITFVVIKVKQGRQWRVGRGSWAWPPPSGATVRLIEVRIKLSQTYIARDEAEVKVRLKLSEIRTRRGYPPFPQSLLLSYWSIKKFQCLVFCSLFLSLLPLISL